MQHNFDHHDVNISSGGLYYNPKNNSFKRNTNRINMNDQTSPSDNEKFDIKTNNRILNNNRLISEIIDSAKNLSNKSESVELFETKSKSSLQTLPKISLNSYSNIEEPNTPKSMITSKVKPSNFRRDIIRNNISPHLQIDPTLSSIKELILLEKKDMPSPREKNQNLNKIDATENEKSLRQKKNYGRTSIKNTYQRIIAQNILELDKHKKIKDSKIKNDTTHLLNSKMYESWLLDTNQSLDSICTIKSENITIKDDNKNLSLLTENISTYQSLETTNLAHLASNNMQNTQETIETNLKENKQTLLNLKTLKEKVENEMNSPSKNILNFAIQKSYSKVNKTNFTLAANSILKLNIEDIEKPGVFKLPNNIEISSPYHLQSKNNIYNENHNNLHTNGIFTNLNQETNNTIPNIGVNGNHKGGNILFQNLLVHKINTEKNNNDALKVKILDSLVNSEEYMNIKKELPSFLSDVPASRQEVIILSNWLNSRVKEILQDAHLTIQGRADKMDEIYNLCLNEMFRQISMDCNERGRLLSTLWTSYLEQFDQFRSLIQEEKRKLILESENSYNRVHKMYKEKMQSQNQVISELTNEIHILFTKNKHLDLDHQMALKLNEQSAKKNIEYKRLLGSCRKQILVLKKDNQLYSSRLDLLSNSKVRILSNNIPQDEEGDSSDILSDASSEIVFENQSIGKIETMKIGSLNSMINNIDLKMKYSNVEVQTCFNEDYIVNSSKETQTHFNFIDKKYNLILRNQKAIDEILLEHKFKYELDMLSEAKLIYVKQTEVDEKINKRRPSKKFNHIDEIRKKHFSKDDLSKNRKRKNSWDGIPKTIDNEKYKILMKSQHNFKKEISQQIFSLLGEDFEKIVKYPINQSDFVKNSSKLLTKANPNKKNMVKTPAKDDDIIPENFYEVAKFEILDEKDASSSSDSESNSKSKPNIHRINIGNIPSDISMKLNQIYKSKKLLKPASTIKRSIRIPIIPEEQESDEEYPNFVVKFLGFSNKSQKIGLKLIDSIINHQNHIDKKKALIRIIRLYKIESEKTRVYELLIIDLHHNNTDLKKNIVKLNEEIKSLKDKLNNNSKKGINLNNNTEIRENNDEELCITCGRKYNDEELDKEFLSLQNEFKGINFEFLGEKQASTPKSKFSKSRTMMFYPDKLSQHENVIKNDKFLQNQENATMGMVIINKLKSLRIHSFKNFMSLKQVLKLITQVYDERLLKSKEFAATKEEELGNFTLKIFQLNMKGKGAKHIALQKFVIFLLSLKKYLNTVRVNLFTKFLGFNESFQYNLDEFNRYIDFLQHSTTDTTIINGESDTRHFVPFQKALDYTKVFLENKFEYEGHNQFIKELDSLKEYDQKNMNKNGLIDIDLFIIKILTKYREVCNFTKRYVINAFKAADLDSNHRCSFQEFNILYKYIEFEKYDEEFVKHIFEQNVDIINETEKALSFDKFTVICVEYSLFSDAKQDLFLKINGQEELQEKFIKLQQKWENDSNDIKEKIKNLIDDNKEYWNQILEVLNERIKNETNYKPFLIAYSILSKEINYLQENEILKKMLD